MSKEKNRYQYLAKFAYIGSSFYGVQEQPNHPSALGSLRKRVEKITGQSARALVAASRTDRGVHALENFATFYLAGQIDQLEFLDEMRIDRNDGLLGVSLRAVSRHVHARANSCGKEYRYSIVDNCDDYKLSVENKFAWQVAPKLCQEKMIKAARAMIGEKDFSSLRGGGCQAASTVKNIFSIKISKTPSGTMLIDIHGKAFLRRMIRNLVGLLVEVGSGLRAPDTISRVLAARSRNEAGIMAPAHGLCLMRVGFEIVDKKTFLKVRR